MSCSLCSSLNEAEFNSETVIHQSGLKHLDDSGEFVFPKVLVCLDCDASRFSMPVKERWLLRGVLPGRC